MHALYRRALFVVLALLGASVALGYICLNLSRLDAPLLPSSESALPWRSIAGGDADQGGGSRMEISQVGRGLRADFIVTKDIPHPFVSLDLYFVDEHGRRIHRDLSRYTGVSFTVRCKPANTLQLNLPTFDRRVSTRDNLVSYRTPIAYFSCHERGTRVSLDLTRLETPDWWFNMFKLDLSQQDYRLDQVPKIGIGTSFQSPRMVASRLDVEDLRFEGEDGRYLVLLGALLTLAWSGFGLWFFRAHARALEAAVRDRLQQDRPLVAYQQLTLAPHRDREKSTVLAHLAEHFAEPEIDLETAAAHTGVNRNKINEILKAEFNLTFTGYLNKLRLTEAARLLAASDRATVAEIAHAVGYNNVSYFNKLFKAEYDCTPKAFRDAATAGTRGS